jgi:hypothetical protein
VVINKSLDIILKLKVELDPIVRNKFRDNPAMIAAWESASRLERASVRKRLS